MDSWIHDHPWLTYFTIGGIMGTVGTVIMVHDMSKIAIAAANNAQPTPAPAPTVNSIPAGSSSTTSVANAPPITTTIPPTVFTPVTGYEANPGTSGPPRRRATYGAPTYARRR